MLCLSLIQFCTKGFYTRSQGDCVISLGSGCLQIESSTIQISSRPNLIVDYDPILIPTTILYPRSQLGYKCDLFLIKINRLKDQYKSIKRLKESIKRSKLSIKR